MIKVSPLNIFRAVNNLYGTSGKASIYPDYVASLNMHDSEKTAIFGEYSTMLNYLFYKTDNDFVFTALQNNGDGQKSTETYDSVAKTKRYIYHLTEAW